MPMQPPSAFAGTLARRVPLWIKLPYTAFLCVLVPIYWRDYGPTNFLYFCDVALFITLVAVWRESPFLSSMASVGILLPQAFWVADFAACAVGLRITGLTAYMFEAHRPLFTRLLSLFHGWLPFLLAYLVWRLGYDRRAFLAWTVLALALVVVCYAWLPPPPAPPDNPNLPVNINYVYGLSDSGKQTLMPDLAWLALLLVGLPVLIYWPTHVALKKLCRERPMGQQASA